MKTKNMLRTAVDLKEAIEKVSDYFEPLGSCPLDVFTWEYDERGKYYDVEDSGEDGDKKSHYQRMTQISEATEKIQKSLNAKYHQELSFPESDRQISIQFGEFKYQGSFNMSQETLKVLFDLASPAPYGDQKNLETVVNTEVRDARDISLEHFEISPEVIREIADRWREGQEDGYLYPRNVIVKPYKINLYGKDGHFELHQDTPGKDMVGTVLIAISKSHGSGLEIQSPHDKDEIFLWDQKPGDCIMFYTDSKHKVGWVRDNKIRGTIAFKIYHNTMENDLGNGNDIVMINRTATSIEGLESVIKQRNDYGFLLGHGYSLQTKTFKGKDHILVSALDKLGRHYKVIPIVHTWNVFSYHLSDYGDEEEENEATSNLYPFGESHIDHILGRGPKPDPTAGNLQFFSINGTEYIWKDEHQQYCEYVGNSAQPEEQNSIYLNRALLIT